jgi:murein DD-endopeptidase MepM/ murein hydrolase activator NlpD
MLEGIGMWAARWGARVSSRLVTVSVAVVMIVVGGWDGVEIPVGAGVGVGGWAVPANASSAGTWAWPTGSRVVLRPFQAPANDYGPGHRGLDVEATIGGPVLAPADGVVAFAGSVAGRGVVTIDHGGGLVSTLDSVTPTMAAGHVVSRGQPVGVAAVGHCPASAPCLHLGARLDDRYVDPRPYLGAPTWPVLLPVR